MVDFDCTEKVWFAVAAVGLLLLVTSLIAIMLG